MERAREYDRVSEWLAENKKRGSSQESDASATGLKSRARYGVEGRRQLFEKDSYRQPVLTRKPMHPKNYRRGQPDPEAEIVTSRLRELREHCRNGTKLGDFNKSHTEEEVFYDTPEFEEESFSEPEVV